MDTCLNAAFEYLDMGFSIIPVKRSDKKPYITWKEFQGRLPTSEEVEKWWTMWPNANVAIITGSISNLYAVDADGSSGIQWINEHLPKTGVYNNTSKGVHALLRPPPGVTIKNAVRITPEVDVRGEGGYIIVPPSIHKDGHQYVWQYIMDGWDDLAVFDIAGLNGHKKTGNLNINLSDITEAPTTAPKTEGERNDSLTRLAGSWFQKGLALGEVLVLAKSWNATNNPPLPEKELIRTVESIHTLDLVNNPEKAFCLEPDMDDAELVPIPESVLKPGGVLQDIMEYITVNSPVSVPIYNLAAAVTLIGNVLGQKVQTETGLRTNIYSIVLGFSGSGKNAALSVIPQLLARSDAYRTMGVTELTSSTAVLRGLSIEGGRVSLITIDEIGYLLKGLKNPNSAASDIPRLLIKLFSGTDRPEIKNYADGKMIVVPWHHLSFYGASTPDRFWESLTSGETVDGFLARILLWESHHDAPMPSQNIKFHENPALIKSINDLYNIDIKLDTTRGNLEAVPIPKIIPRSDEAQQYFLEVSKKYHNLKNQHKTSEKGLSSIYGRAAEHIAKLALIHAASEQGKDIRIVNLNNIEWACTTVKHLIDNLIVQVEENISDSEMEKTKSKILKSIRKHMKKRKYKGASLSDLMRGPLKKYGSKKQCEDLLQTLKVSQVISNYTYKPTSGPDFEVFYTVKPMRFL